MTTPKFHFEGASPTLLELLSPSKRQSQGCIRDPQALGNWRLQVISTSQLLGDSSSLPLRLGPQRLRALQTLLLASREQTRVSPCGGDTAPCPTV